MSSCRKTRRSRPEPCAHLVAYRKTRGAGGYSYLRGFLGADPDEGAAVGRQGSRITRCGLCFRCRGRLYLCLVCSWVSCSEHALAHPRLEAGHEIAVDVERAELFCCACADQVYDPEFDRAIVGGQVVGLLPKCSESCGGKRRRPSAPPLEEEDGAFFPWGLRGLNNLGNTCFMNSVLQVLLHTSPLRNHFLTDQHGQEVCRRRRRRKGPAVEAPCLACDISSVFSAVFFGGRTPYSPARLLYSAHLDFIRKRQPRSSQMEIERFHTLEFSHWFKAEVNILQEMNKEALSTKLRWLKDRPLNVVKKFDACLVNGFRFHIQKVEQRRTTQNSGVVMTAKTSSFSSSKDKSLIHGDVTYYGILDEIVEFNYNVEMKILLFKCDWVDTQRGVKEEECFTLVNFKHKLRTSEPYVLASQVEQVWYVEDPKYDGFHVVRKTRPRNYFDMHCEESIENDGNESSPIVVGDNLDNIFDDDINVVWERHDIEGMEVPL